MTREEAIKILDPETSRGTLWKYEDKEDRMEAVNEACRIAVDALRAQQKLNAPLTLEELRGLEGDSVWVEIIGYIGVRDGNYALVKGFDDEYVYLPSIADPDDLASIDLYEENWIAYRRRPEEETA